MSIDQELLGQVIKAARQAQLGQNHLASAAGVAPETISRAKKRGTIDLGTLQALAAAVGLTLALEPAAAPAAARPTPRPGDRVTPAARAALSHRSRGLAWSNPAVSGEVLVRNALKKGAFHLLLDAALEYGLPFVWEQWKLVQSDLDLGLSDRARGEIGRKLANIERGLHDAQTGH